MDKLTGISEPTVCGIQNQIDALRESLTVLDDPHHFAAIARNMSESADTMTAMLAVVEAAEKLQADMIMRADMGTYDGDHSVQAGATVWWVFCERIKDLSNLKGEE